MAVATDFADPPSDLYQVDPLDLDEIDFSCAVDEKETNEFDYGDNLFQKPDLACGETKALVNCSTEFKHAELNSVCEPQSVNAFEKVDEDVIKNENDTGTDTENAVTTKKNIALADEGQTTTHDNHINKHAEICRITVEFVDEQNDVREIDGSEENAGTSALAAAQAEWDKVECVEAGYADPSQTQGGKGTEIVTTPLITFNEALQHFQNANLQHLKPEIQTTVNRTGLSALKYFLFGPPALSKELVTEREMAFCIAASGFDNSNEVHLRVLQTVYRILIGSKFDCPRYGSHYEEIGFQGNDPATDLRGGGFLGLMHILHLLTDQRTLPLAREIYKLSTDETQNFPFCLMGINISRITLQATREGCLNKECNRRRQVVAVMNDFYVGIYLHLYDVWKYQHKTIGDSGFVLKEVEHFAKKNPKSVMKRLESYLSKQKENTSVVSSLAASGDQVVIDKLT